MPPRADAVVPGVRSIAVLRANALGDFIVALPALEALRRAYPRARITLLGSDRHRELLAGRRSPVDEVVAIPPGRGVRDDAPPAPDAAHETFLRVMRARRFDVALQLHGGGRNSNAIVRALGARVTAGLCTPDAPPLDRSVAYVYQQHELLRWLEAVALLGARPTTLAPHLQVTAADRQAVPSELRSARYVVLHPGATDPRRRWPVERFAAVGDVLAERGYAVAIAGVEQERALVQGVVRHMRADAIGLCGALRLRGLVGLLAGAALVVGNDSGPMHVASAVGTPTVGIYWIGNLVQAAPLFRARHRPLASYVGACPVCGRSVAAPRCPHDPSFVTEVDVEQVVEAASELLAASPAPTVLRPRAGAR